MNVTVYCASSDLIDQKYRDAAVRLGHEIGSRGYTLVNGAGCFGLMSATTDACLAAGGTAIGVIPQFMIDRGWCHKGMSRIIATSDMHERKETMARMADLCVALPGGVGTLEELLEAITWRQLGIINHPVVILNLDGFFDPLLAQFERCRTEHFMRPTPTPLYEVVTTVEQLLPYL